MVARRWPTRPDLDKPRAKARVGAVVPGVVFPRFFTEAGVDPFDEVRWELREAVIGNGRGEVVFEQRDVEIPSSWSQQATNIVVSKYFRGQIGAPERERSVKQLIGRVVTTITEWARAQKYFASDEDLQAFSDDLKHILVYQKAAFNSPVWFNCGFEKAPQCSACFINSVQDTMDSILTLARTEGMLFKFGSGTGTNLSPIRSSRELLAGGGTASGPVSFMKGYDAFAGVIKSGGKTRRAAKMVILNADHPDIVEFINCKVEEERKAWALIDAGYDGSFTGPAYSSVFFQNSNNSVRVTDDFMRAVLDDSTWDTHAVRDGRVMDSYRARDIMRLIAEGTHVCGDPGMQFDTTINEWHTCPETDRIHASNPCSEYMFLNDSACNLSSINLMKFVREDGEFDVVSYKAAIRTLIMAQEIIIDNASYPTDAIGRNSHAYRPLGLGYANLGALLMSRGLPYDSDAGRDYAAAVTALMTGEAYAQSARISRDHGGAFSGYEKNRDSMLRVIRKHRDALRDVNGRNVPPDLFQAARVSWDDAVELGEQFGYRNAQVSVLAPTGTIGFMMDCDTTGVEPDIALVKYKKLVGGGLMKIVNQTVPMALKKLGYSQAQIDAIVDLHRQERNHRRCAGAQGFAPARVRLRVQGGEGPALDSLHGPHQDDGRHAAVHLRRHLEDGERAERGDRRRDHAGLHPILEARGEGRFDLPRRQQADRSRSIRRRTRRRPSSRRSRQGLVTQPVRRKLPDERHALTHKFDIAGHEGYITVGLFENGQPGEIFLVMAKEGSTISGFADAFAQAISYALQYGVPLQVLVDKFSHVRFEPSGMTRNPEIRFAKSIVDYIFRWMASKFLSREAQFHAGVNGRELDAAEVTQPVPAAEVATASNPAPDAYSTIQNQEDAPPCSTCGAIMIRSGACYKCANCGNTSGCA